jgi:LacI family transcriptional regulator
MKRFTDFTPLQSVRMIYMAAKITIKDVAKRAGVSLGTASKVINGQGNVDPKLRDKVMEAVSDLNYRANAIARSLRSSSSFTLAVMLADITNPFQMMLARGIEEVAYKNGYHLLMSSTKEDPEIERQNLNMLFEKRVDGLILVTTGQSNDELYTFLRAGVPVVLIDRPVTSLPVDIVADDNLLGMELLIDHLYQFGHRRIAYVGGDESQIHGRMRYQGVMNAFEKHRLKLLPELHRQGKFTYESGYEAVQYLFGLDEPPTAILSANNNITAGILRASRDLGIRIPQDLSVVGFGDLEYSWNLIVPSVTVVSQSPLMIGRRAAELILQRLTSTEDLPRTHIYLTPELLVRDSSDVVNKNAGSKRKEPNP